MAGLQSDPAHLQRMKQFAVSDAKHDFKALFTDLYPKQRYDIGTPLPDPVEPSNDNWGLLSSYTTENLDFQNLPLKSPVNITTVTGHKYDICVFDAHDLDSIMPFLYNGGPQEANFVIDAFASSIWNDFDTRRTGKSLGTINILTNRETVNDPGPKVPPNDKIYERNDNAEGLRDIQLNSYQDANDEDITYPAWPSPRKDFHNDFFSSYYLKLSRVTYDENRELINMSFSQVEGTDDMQKYAVTNAGDTVNSIKTLSARLKQLNEKDPIFGILLQMKRSGDSLQGLSTLDKTRKYKGRSKDVRDKTLMNLATTYTYALSHDVWNCAYNILIGASFILLTNDNNRIYVCRTGLPKDPVKDFIADGAKLIEEHNAAVITYRVSFDKVVQPQLVKYTEKLRNIETFTRENLSEDPSKRKNVQESIESVLNQLLRQLFLFSVPLTFLFSEFKSKEILTMPSEITPITVGEIMNTISSQKVIQADADTLFARLTESMKSVNFTLIDQINFFSSESMIVNTKANIKYMKPLLATLSLIASINIDLVPIIPKTYEILKSINASNYIQKKYKSYTQKSGFNIVFDVFLSVYDDIIIKNAKPSRKRERSEEEGVVANNTKSFEDLEKIVITSYFLDIRNQSLLREQQRARLGEQKGGKRRKRRIYRGGFVEDEDIPFLTGEFLIQRQINRLLVPVTIDILEETGKETDEERKMLINYILMGITKFLSYQPQYENADHISKWGPIFVEMMKPILEDSDQKTQRLKLKFFLGIWLTENPIENINITMDVPALYWKDMASEAGHVLIDFIFGQEVYELLGQQEPYKIKYNLEIKYYQESYESAYRSVSNMLNTESEAVTADVIASTVTAPEEIISGAISQPVLITGIGANTFKKGLSTPSPPTPFKIVDGTPTLVPGTLPLPLSGSSAKVEDPKLGGAKKTRKIKRKTFKYKRCPTKRHFKI